MRKDAIPFSLPDVEGLPVPWINKSVDVIFKFGEYFVWEGVHFSFFLERQIHTMAASVEVPIL
ncbi:hypothetical protein VDG1235_873 [Verrucomicrobiia bacterium DG1235]|nr:hypothetical protein VDG1235_873 [Verrucomicrobiae bacterium DG1235]